MPHTAPNINRLWADLIVHELTRLGVHTFFVAPGSRSTPLVTAIAAHPDTHAFVHVDERGGAFAALGYGRASGTPAAWVTTSGTAVANGLPAAVEADADGIPLLMLTADRPPELRETGANQAIRQPGIYGDTVRWAFDVPAPTREVDPAFLLSTVDHAVHRSRHPAPGPVHVNMQFREPLAPEEDASGPAHLPAHLDRWWSGTAPWTRNEGGIAQADARHAAAVLAGRERGVVVAGRTSSTEIQAARSIAARLGWPLLADVQSGLRLGASEGVVRFADALLAAGKAPDGIEAVIQVGDPPVSKRLLHAMAQSPVWIVCAGGLRRLDPHHRVTHRLPAAGPLAQQLAARRAGAWLDEWQHADRAAAAAMEHPSEDLTEPAVASLLARNIPPEHALFLGSSMPVRLMDSFAAAGSAPIAVGANRGASGIDGSVSTAVGMGIGADAPVTLLLGDLALLHDLNGLLLARGRAVVTVVINNDGGGIFSMLPIAAHSEVFEPYFGTPHGIGFEDAARLFGLSYRRPATPGEFVQSYREACASDAPWLIEVRTDRARLREDQESLFGRIAGAP